MLITCAHCDAQRGLSLVELMVGLTVSLLVIFGALSMFAVSASAARDTLSAARLNAEIRTAMDVMVADIRRAGYGGDVFTQRGSTDLAVYESGACLVYSYDKDLNRALSTASPYEYFGFRVDGGEIKVRSGGDDLSVCDEVGDAREWEGLTESTILQVESLEAGETYFTIEYQCLRGKAATTNNEIGNGQRCVSGQAVYDAAAAEAASSGSPRGLVETRKVTITLPVRSATDDEMRIRLSQEVMVRNHRIVTVPAS